MDNYPPRPPKARGPAIVDPALEESKKRQDQGHKHGDYIMLTLSRREGMSV